MKLARTLIITAIIPAMLLGACSFTKATPTPTPTVTDTPTPLPTPTNTITLTPTPGIGIPHAQGTLPPRCTGTDLGSAYGLSVDAIPLDTKYPAIEVIDGTLPSLHWRYDYPGCAPAGFVVAIGWMNDDTSMNWGVVRTTGPATWQYSVTAADGLKPATRYFWSVHPYLDLTTPQDYFPGVTSFVTGPLCIVGSSAPPAQVYPPDGMVFTNGGMGLSWQYPKACLPFVYEVDLALDSGFTTGLQEQKVSYDLHLNNYAGTGSANLQDCTTYYWRVGASDDGVKFVYSPALSFTMNLNGACGGGATPIPSVSPTPEGVTFTTTLNAFCRAGPDTGYASSGLAMVGIPYPVIGRNVQGSWYSIQLTASVVCWVPSGDGSAAGDTLLLPQLTAVAPACIQVNTSKLCDQYADQCTWNATSNLCEKK